MSFSAIMILSNFMKFLIVLLIGMSTLPAPPVLDDVYEKEALIDSVFYYAMKKNFNPILKSRPSRRVIIHGSCPCHAD
jgi:hypothetical protein